VRHLRLEDSGRLVRKRGQHRCREGPRRNGHDTDQLVREVACGREGEGDDATLGRGIRGLSGLPVVGGDGRGHHDDPAVTVNRLVLEHGCGAQAQDVESPNQVDVYDVSEGLEVHRPLPADDPAGRADACAVNDDAQVAERLGRSDRSLHLGLVAHVGRAEADPVAEFRGEGLAGGGAQVDDDDGGAALVQTASRRRGRRHHR